MQFFQKNGTNKKVGEFDILLHLNDYNTNLGKKLQAHSEKE